MIEVKGRYNIAICYCESLDKTAQGQIKAVCDMECFADSRIRIMPDVHAGMGCTIGTTMTIADKVVPGMVGVDIGCGMETLVLEDRTIDFAKLDDLIRKEIPSGYRIRKDEHPFVSDVSIESLRCAGYVDMERAKKSIGTLGGGNHFIEVDTDEEGRLYLVVHSGSRHLGKEVAEHYQRKAFENLCGDERAHVDEMIRKMKADEQSKETKKALKNLRKQKAQLTPVPKDLSYVEGELLDDYIHDMRIVQEFAAINRKAMVDIIIGGMDLTVGESFTTIHNYIDIDKMILRKGAISAEKGEKVLIPINMKDGSLICLGKGNADWNCSAPHGAGRVMSRKEARENLSMDRYKEEMNGIFTTCVSRSTLDEAPMAYKDIEEVVRHIHPTADIIERIRPVYNFKAAK